MKLWGSTTSSLLKLSTIVLIFLKLWIGTTLDLLKLVIFVLSKLLSHLDCHTYFQSRSVDLRRLSNTGSSKKKKKSHRFIMWTAFDGIWSDLIGQQWATASNLCYSNSDLIGHTTFLSLAMGQLTYNITITLFSCAFKAWGLGHMTNFNLLAYNYFKQEDCAKVQVCNYIIIAFCCNSSLYTMLPDPPPLLCVL